MGSDVRAAFEVSELVENHLIVKYTLKSDVRAFSEPVQHSFIEKIFDSVHRCWIIIRTFIVNFGS